MAQARLHSQGLEARPEGCQEGNRVAEGMQEAQTGATGYRISKIQRYSMEIVDT